MKYRKNLAPISLDKCPPFVHAKPDPVDPERKKIILSP
jgi:hypothetical protein